MLLEQLPGSYKIAKLKSIDQGHVTAILSSTFFCILKSKTENSIVVDESLLQGLENVQIVSDNQWSCFRLQGNFSFNEAGVLSKLIKPISDSGIGIFAVSSFDTDYLLIQYSDLNTFKELNHIEIVNLEIAGR